MKTRIGSGVALALLALGGCGGQDDGAPDAGDSATFTITSSPTATASARRARSQRPAGEGLGKAVGDGSPTTFIAKFYAAYVSPNVDCSDPILLEDHGTVAETFDVIQAPTLFAGSPPDGSYPCLIMKQVDVFSFKPDATAVAAHAGCESVDTTYTFDTYREGSADDGLWESLDGTNIDATGSSDTPGEDTTYTFFSTDVPAIRATNGETPNEHQVIALSSALVVPGAATMYLDFTDGLGEENGTCAITGGSIGFR